MRTSAVLIVAAIGLIAIQVLVTDGSGLNPVSLPVGLIPLEAGLVALVVGVIVGAFTGNPRYRLAMALAIFGALLIAFGLMVTTTGGPGRRPLVTINEMALYGGLLLWVIAFVMGASALRLSRITARDTQR